MQIDRHIAISAGWVAGPAFGVAMMAAPEALSLSHYLAVWLFWGGIAVFLATLGVVFIASKHERERTHMALGPIIMMSIGLLIFGTGFAWYWWSTKIVQSSPQITQPNLPDAQKLELNETVKLECLTSQMPVVTPEMGKVHIIAIRPIDPTVKAAMPRIIKQTVSMGIGSSTLGEPGPLIWTRKCKLTNYSSTTLLGARVIFVIKWYRQNDVMGPDNFIYMESTQSLPTDLGVTPNNVESFFIGNLSDFNVSVEIFGNIVVQPIGEARPRVVKLLPPENTWDKMFVLQARHTH